MLPSLYNFSILSPKDLSTRDIISVKTLIDAIEPPLASAPVYFMNIVCRELNNYFTSSSKNKKEDILRAIFSYISSKTPLSGKFVIAK